MKLQSALALALSLAGATAPSLAADPPSPVPPPIEALPRLEITPYLGTWYQVALFPNRFQRQCVADTTATYRRLPDGDLEVINRCGTADGRVDAVTGVARPDGASAEGDVLAPAQLRVSFLPAWLRWLPVWGRYWVLDLAPDGRYAVVGEPTREYLWVLARTPRLADTDRTAIRSLLQRRGYDLARWQDHPHNAPP